MEGWHPGVCASIGAYDSELIEDLNKNIEHSIAYKRSIGGQGMRAGY